MKCPKCHYLSFDPEPRCRNCGYTLSLDPDLEIHPPSAGPDAPLADLALRDFEAVENPGMPPARPAPTPRRIPSSPQGESERRARTTTPGPFDELLEVAVEAAEAVPVEDRPVASADVASLQLEVSAADARPEPGRPEVRAARPVPPATAELPLFVQGIGKDFGPEAGPVPTTTNRIEPDATQVDAPVVPPPAPVRRTPPDTPPRPRASRTGAQRPFGPLDHDLLEGLQEIELAERRHASGEARRERQETAAGVRSRAAAAVVDAALLGILATGLVSVTLRWAGLDWGQVQVLPVAPLAGFILVIVTGYLFMFTAAGGQTVGKMLLGIRVVDAGASGAGLAPLSVRQALYREALTVPSVLLCGAGFLTVLTGDGRAVHDRLTQTRVVRA